MSKRAPSTSQLVVIAAFALSCFGILLFLWVTFGGPTPFKAKQYEIKIPFDEATQLAEQSDVRISGVNVGKVQSIELAPNKKQALAIVQIDDQYAPIPESTRALLRTKTLLGETYVELTPASKEGKQLPDGAALPEANIAQSVQLDEIFRAFDPKTRAAFQSWMQEAAVAIDGQGQNLSYAIGSLEPSLTEFEGLFRTLNSQKVAVAQLFHNGTKTFEALRGRDGELASLIKSSNAVFTTTAKRNEDIEALFRAFPTFLDESKLTLNRLSGFSANADPLLKQLVPAAEQLSPTLVSIAELAPEAKAFFGALEKVNKLAPTGFPALRKLFRDEFPPLLRALDPFLRNLNPILVGLNLYKHETTAFFGNFAAVFNGLLPTETAGSNEPRPHYLRAVGPMTPETLASFPERLNTNRASAYSPPEWADLLEKGALPSFNAAQCSTGITATLDPNTSANPAFRERTLNGGLKAAGKTLRNPGNVALLKKYEENVANFAANEQIQVEELLNRLSQYALGGQTSTSTMSSPACKQQNKFTPIYGSGPATSYQRTHEQSGRP